MKPPRRLFRNREHPPDILEIVADSQDELERFRARFSPAADQALAAMPEEAARVLLLFFFARYKGLDLVTANRRLFDLAGKGRGDHINAKALPQPLRRIWEGGID
jgi:hypothetical protein